MSVKRGDIYDADLSPVVGSEQGGIRPVLIVQNDVGNRYSPTVIAAAITSQREKGWICLPEHYDDGGFSGGNMNRPAMTRLKEDIAAGKIDMVVCYKIDRLSRSILDFAELQSFFEKHNILFINAAIKRAFFGTVQFSGNGTGNAVRVFAVAGILHNC